MGKRTFIVAGIDVGSDRKGFHAVGLNGRTVTEFSSADAKAIAAWCKEFGATVVAVDSPIAWSLTGRARPAERALKANKIWCFDAQTVETKAIIFDTADSDVSHWRNGMTLCLVWRDAESIHFCSDSRLTLASNSYADVAVKVLSLPVNIYSPRDVNGSRTLDHQSEIGMCFAGSAVNSLLIKESLAELLKELQYAPGYTDMSMHGLATFMFCGYRQISKSICSTTLREKGRAAIVIAGRCPAERKLKAFIFETDENNVAGMRQILTAPGKYEAIGTGKDYVRSFLPSSPTSRDFINAVRAVISSGQVDTVGGPVQYGTFRGDRFQCFGVTEFDGSQVRYWRAGLDVNGEDFIGRTGNFIPGFSFLESAEFSGPSTA